MKKLLLFGFDDLPAVLAVAAAVTPMGIEAVPVSRREYDRPLEVLAGLVSGGGASASAPGPLGGRMIVLCGLEDQLDTVLPALAKAGTGPECLKAVLTAHNRCWSARKLFTELDRERRAFQRGGRP